VNPVRDEEAALPNPAADIYQGDAATRHRPALPAPGSALEGPPAQARSCTLCRALAVFRVLVRLVRVLAADPKIAPHDHEVLPDH
jgi:hypothetical protein